MVPLAAWSWDSLLVERRRGPSLQELVAEHVKIPTSYENRELPACESSNKGQFLAQVTNPQVFVNASWPQNLTVLDFVPVFGSGTYLQKSPSALRTDDCLAPRIALHRLEEIAPCACPTCPREQS
jgi:hypothetical protein